MSRKKIRDYEVSIWTLQDEFISVLKLSHLEHKGQIEQGKINIKDDGTQELTFSIPMYIYQGTIRVENPIWYNVRNGNLIVNMRKIKVIFNKDDTLELTDWPRKLDNVFEFSIVDVKERHEEDQLWCDVTCESTIFNELGKVGYKVSLSSEDYYNEDYEHFVAGTTTPPANLQYWVGKFLDPVPSAGQSRDRNKWYYSLEMNWNSFEGTNRNSHTVYEEPYTTSWDDNNGVVLTPVGIAASKEKERMVELEESNYYNLTQNIAEIFGVFCKYCYLYDSNYHIVGREVVFYNNYFNEEEQGYLALTYPFTAASITREQDGKDITTKMFVKSVSDEQSISGVTTILDVEANRSKEDYVLDFNYLYSIGAITDEQYQDIDAYEALMHKYNNQLVELSQRINELSTERIDVDAKHTVAQNSIPLDEERIETASALLENLVERYGDEAQTGIEITSANPESAILLHDSNDEQNIYYINVKSNGMLPNTLHVYGTYNYTTRTLSNEITTWTIEYDEDYGNVSKIKNIYNTGGSTVYLTYTYRPKLYYDRVINTWTVKLGADTQEESDTAARLVDIDTELATLNTTYNSILENKQAAVKAFEQMMGPALRESYWMPEDYSNYGDNYLDTLNLNNNVVGASGISKFIWDSTLFDEEQKSYYYVGAGLTQYNYPVFDLSGHATFVMANWDRLSIIVNDTMNISSSNALRSVRNYPINSLCQYGFAFDSSSNKYLPVLIFTGYEKLVNSTGSTIDTDFINRILNCRVGVYTVTINGSTITPSIGTGAFQPTCLNSPSAGGTAFQAINIYYPRIQIDSSKLKTSSDQLAINYGGTILNEYEDYYILFREANTIVGQDNDAYFITLKPQSIIKYCHPSGDNFNIMDSTVLLKIKFTLSNADTAIYLDALKIIKENSRPKVSYTITPSMIKNDEFLYTAYNKLTHICNINDYELKFKNVQGYISEIHLDLDMPWNDTFEIKNYRNKFEDLFSSIVAQTEQMKMTSANLEQINNYIAANKNLSYKDFNEQFLNSSELQDYLKSLFDEAGAILSSANSTVDNLYEVSEKNAAILSNYSENVKDKLTPNVYVRVDAPIKFKQGDIWKQKDAITGEIINIYVATANSDDVEKPGDGWSKTYDGKLAAITGASLDIDADAGIVDIKAQNQINIQSGHNVDIAANANVNITGNQSVNIGGTSVNIGSYQYTDSQEQQHTVLGGIHLVNTAVSNAASATSKVDIDANGIELASTNGIIIKSGAGIDIKSGDVNNISVVSINKDDGIYLGSNKGINLYSGAVGTSNTMVQLNNNHLLLGVSDTSSGSASEFTKEKIVLAVGGNVDNVTETNLSYDASSPVSGVLIKKDYIGMAVGTGNNRTSMTLNSDGFLAAASNTNLSSHTGNYVKISAGGIDIGGTSDVHIDTSNVKILTDSDGNNSDIRFALGTTASNIFTPALKFDTSGNLSINGKVVASELYIGDENNQLTFSNGIFSIGTTKINDIHIGGVNLLKETSRGFSEWGIEGNYNITPWERTVSGLGKCVRYTLPSGSSVISSFTIYNYVTYSELVSGEMYTLSTKVANYNQACEFTVWDSTDGVTWTNKRNIGQLQGYADGYHDFVCTFTASTTKYMRVGITVINFSGDVDLFDKWKLEPGNEVTAWSASPFDPAREVKTEVLTSGAITTSKVIINPNQVYLKAPSFVIDVSGTNGDTLFTQDGLTVGIVNSESVVKRYNGPTAITVRAGSEVSDSVFQNLTDILRILSKTWIDQDIIITIATNTYETNDASNYIILKGTFGSGSITINGGGKEVNGRMGIFNVGVPVNINNLTLTSTYYPNASTYVLNVSASQDIRISDCTIKANGTANDVDGVRCNSGFVKVLSSTINNVRFPIAARSGRIHVDSCEGSGFYGLVAVDGGRITYNNTYPSGSSSDTFSARGGSITGSGSPTGGVTPTPSPVTTTVTATSVATKTYQSGVGWVTDTTLRQGDYNSITHYGVISFSTTGWSGKTIVAGELTLRRFNGGKGSPIVVRMKTTTSTAAAGQAAPNNTTTDYGSIGNVNINNTLTCAVPAAALQEIANGTRKSLMLYANGSTDYGVFAGSDDSTYKPTLTVTYTT